MIMVSNDDLRGNDNLAQLESLTTHAVSQGGKERERESLSKLQPGSLPMVIGALASHRLAV